MAYELSRRQFLKGAAVSGVAIASEPLIRGLEAAFGYGSTVHAQPKTNVSREFLNKLNKWKELFARSGKGLGDLLVEGEEVDKGFQVIYEAELTKEVKEGTTYWSLPVRGLKKGAPLVLKIGHEKYPNSQSYEFYPGKAEYLEDTNLDGLVDSYTNVKGPSLDVKKLPANIRASIQQKYEAGLRALMIRIDEIVAEYAGVKAVPKTTKK